MNVSYRGVARITAFGVLLIGCARTHVSSVVAPEALGTVYRRTLVLFPVSDLEARKQVEDRFSYQATCTGAQGSFMPCPFGPPPDSAANAFVPSYSLLFPGRASTNEDVARVTAENDLDAALVIMLGSGDPATALTTQTAQARCLLWPTTPGCDVGGMTTATYDMSHPWSGFTLVLFDVRSDSVVWVASARSGDGMAGTNAVLRSLVSSTVVQMRLDSLLP